MCTATAIDDLHRMNMMNDSLSSPVTIPTTVRNYEEHKYTSNEIESRRQKIRSFLECLGGAVIVMPNKANYRNEQRNNTEVLPLSRPLKESASAQVDFSSQTNETVSSQNSSSSTITGQVTLSPSSANCVILDHSLQKIVKCMTPDESKNFNDALRNAAQRFFSHTEPIPNFPQDPRPLSVKTLRKYIPVLRMHAYPASGQLSQRQKIKHIWEEKPADWPEQVIFKDPNNNRKGGKKPSKSELVKMYNFLYDKFNHRQGGIEQGMDAIVPTNSFDRKRDGYLEYNHMRGTVISPEHDNDNCKAANFSYTLPSATFAASSDTSQASMNGDDDDDEDDDEDDESKLTIVPCDNSEELLNHYQIKDDLNSVPSEFAIKQEPVTDIKKELYDDERSVSSQRTFKRKSCDSNGSFPQSKKSKILERWNTEN